jgi:hypothetical protein
MACLVLRESERRFGRVQLILLFASLSVVLGAADAPSVTCELTADPQGRVYVLDRQPGPGDSAWRLSLKDRESGDKWIRLPLPGAAPTIDGETVHLAFKNGNGGRQVTLDVTPQRATLDVFVDYGLDVNIDPDLDPDVDRMSTGGPAPATCRVTTETAR